MRLPRPAEVRHYIKQAWTEEPAELRLGPALFGSIAILPATVAVAWLMGSLTATTVLSLWLFGIVGACAIGYRRP